MSLNKLYETVERKIGTAFECYGRLVARHAWKVILAAIIVNGMLGIGMIKLQSDIETENVYLPQGELRLLMRFYYQHDIFIIFYLSSYVLILPRCDLWMTCCLN